MADKHFQEWSEKTSDQKADMLKSNLRDCFDAIEALNRQLTLAFDNIAELKAEIEKSKRV